MEDGYSGEAGLRQNRRYTTVRSARRVLWENLGAEVSRLPEVFSKALKEIAEQIRNYGMFLIPLTSSNSQEPGKCGNPPGKRSNSSAKLHHVSPDVLGDAYEWILRYFAPQKAKEGRSLHPREVIRLLIEILDHKPGESVCDPASASNGMLIASYAHVKHHYSADAAEQLFLFGQEANAEDHSRSGG